jgi:DNA-directed RNA polymerase subunit alpha
MTKELNNYSIMQPFFELKIEENTDTHGVFILEPLEKGYGQTLGNSLRRVLLESIPGTAVYSVKIDGVDHQYSGIEGVREDVLEMILNLKQLVVKSQVDESGILTLNVKGPKKIMASDIECEAGFEIVNKDLMIADLTTKEELKMEIKVESGLGYKVASERSSNSIGEIFVDSLFSPVKKVFYEISETRVGSKTDYDSLMIDVTTDGSINPKGALMDSASVLKKHYDQILNPVVREEAEDKEEARNPEEMKKMLLTVEELELPTRIANSLRKGGFKTVSDLVVSNRSTISQVKNLGSKSLGIIEEALSKKDVELKD